MRLWVLTWRFLLFSLYLPPNEVGFGFVSALTPDFSDSLFDSPPELVSCISTIADWRKDIPAPIVSEEDFFCSSDFQDMSGSDTISECSMDSAYQSQSGASRRGMRKSDAHTQDNRSRLNTQFVSSEMYSPSMSSDNYNAFTDQALDMGHLRPSTGAWEAQEDSLVYANYSAGQDFSTYATTNVNRFTPTSNVGVSSPWVADAPFHNDQFSFTYPTQSPAELMFSAPAPSQRQWGNSHFESVERPNAVRSSSSYTLPQDSRRTSAHDTNFGAFVATPTSTTSVQFPQSVEFDQTRLLDSRYEDLSVFFPCCPNNIRNENDDTVSTSNPAHMLEENDETLSASDAAEIKLEEERTKVARSHPLYQQLPDKDGKYHCPEEGKAGCSHKPTPLKCNYE